jgi:Poly-beta-hydroxybutyrate polymerase N terminal
MLPRDFKTADVETASIPLEGLDRSLHEVLGHATRAISPTSLVLAYVDWWSHLALSPAKQALLAQKALRKAHRLALYAPQSLSSDAARCIEPLERWLEWGVWLNARSGDQVAPPALGAPEKGYARLADAPGTYVLQ